MSNTWNMIKKICVMVIIAGLCSQWSRAADKPSPREGKASVVEITRINPSKGDLAKIKQKRKGQAQIVNVGQAEQVHVVKLYLDMPRATGRAYVLYIGDQKIDEYGAFAEGIFFKAYERKDLDSWAGQPVRFAARNELIELGVSFPSKEELAAMPALDVTQLPELDQVLKKK